MVESGRSEPEGAGAEQELLSPGDVDIWLLRTDDASASLVGHLRGLLSPEELERTARYRFSRDRDLHAFGRGLVRLLLSRYAPTAPEAWVIRTEAAGRPMIADPKRGPPLDFSVSHTPGLVAIAIGHGVRVGVDVEGGQELFRDPAIGRAILSPQEENALSTLPAEERPAALRRLWVLKEAYGKALGTGLAEGVRDMAFDITDAGTIRMTDRGPRGAANLAEWWFHEAALEGDFHLGIAVHTPAHPAGTLRVRDFVC